jgi:hypothetical protein
MLEKKFLEVICVTYGHNNELKCFINSFKCQDDQDYFLRIIHDGNCKQYKKLKKDLEDNSYLADNITIEATKERFNDYGHSLRDYGLKTSKIDSEFTLITNGNNYYLPKLVNRIKDVYCRYDKITELIFFDLVHYHRFQDKSDGDLGSFSLLDSDLKEAKIDMGACVIRSQVAKKIGFNSRRHNADWDYFSECAKYITGLNTNKKNVLVKQQEVLFVHR